MMVKDIAKHLQYVNTAGKKEVDIFMSKKEESRQLIKSKCEEFDYTGISEIPKVIELIKKRELIEKQINKLDEFALVLYELKKLSIE